MIVKNVEIVSEPLDDSRVPQRLQLDHSLKVKDVEIVRGELDDWKLPQR